MIVYSIVADTTFIFYTVDDYVSGVVVITVVTNCVIIVVIGVVIVMAIFVCVIIVFAVVGCCVVVVGICYVDINNNYGSDSNTTTSVTPT